MNLANSILSVTAEVAASTVEAAEELGVIEQLQALPAAEQVAHEGYWSSVGIITLTGLLVVFAILAILIFLFWAMGKIFGAIDSSKKKKAEAAKAAAKPASAPAAASQPVEEVYEEEDTSDDEIIAVISAAIAAYSEQDGKSYEIRSIKRKDNKARSAWSLAGIGENTRPF